jgi:hypothetical protein
MGWRERWGRTLILEAVRAGRAAKPVIYGHWRLEALVRLFRRLVSGAMGFTKGMLKCSCRQEETGMWRNHRTDQRELARLVSPGRSACLASWSIPLNQNRVHNPQLSVLGRRRDAVLFFEAWNPSPSKPPWRLWPPFSGLAQSSVGHCRVVRSEPLLAAGPC